MCKPLPYLFVSIWLIKYPMTASCVESTDAPFAKYMFGKKGETYACSDHPFVVGAKTFKLVPPIPNSDDYQDDYMI
jgi:hypothetical protein